MTSGIGRWLTRRVELDGAKLALISSERRLTYDELNRRVNRLANALNERGVRQGDRVAGLLPNGNEILEIMFACAKLGAIFVPVNVRLTSEEVRYILDDSSSRTLFYHRSLAPVVEPLRGTLPQILHWVCVGGEGAGQSEYESLLHRMSDVEPDFEVSLEHVHLMMYTSGTTGKPKGALLTHANTTWNAVNMLNAFGLMEEELTLTVAPLFHIGAMNILTTPTLYVGGTVVIHERFDPVQVLETIEREKVTSLFMVPSMWLVLVHVPDFDKYDLRSLRLAISGGSTVSHSGDRALSGAGGAFF